MNALAERLEDVDAQQRAGNAVEPGQKTLKDVLREMEPQLRGVLPQHVDLSRFLLLAVNEVSSVPRLAECTAASVISGVIRAAKLGLEFSADRGQAYLIPRWNNRARQMEATFQIGYKGLIDLAGRGGITVRARDVRDADKFVVEDGLDPVLRHVPELRKDRGDAWAYFAVATFPDGAKEFLVMSRAEIEQHRDRFASSRDREKNVTGPWVEHFDSMARKTVIIRLLGNLPLPVQVAEAVAAEEIPLDLIPNEAALPPASNSAERGSAAPPEDGDSAPPSVPPTDPSAEPAPDDPPAPTDEEKAATELEERRGIAKYMADEARNADADAWRAWAGPAGIPNDSRKWSAAQIDGVIAWITEEPEEATE